MTPIADMVERMLEADASAEIIVLAVRTAEGVRRMSADKSADTRRQRDRERKRQIREAAKSQAHSALTQANDGVSFGAEKSADVSADSADKRCDLASFLPSLKGTSEKESKRESMRARGTRLELGTPLGEGDRAAAIELGASADRLDVMWAEFVDYWIAVPGQRGTKLNWSATWRNRVREVISRGNRNGRFNGQPDRSTSAAGGRVLEKLRGLNRPIGGN